MDLKARILHLGVKKNPGYHQTTGDAHPSYFLEATVLDLETNQVYRCSFRNSPHAERLKHAYKEKWPEAERDALAAQVEAEARQQFAAVQEITLTVTDIRNDSGSILLLVQTP